MSEKKRQVYKSYLNSVKGMTIIELLIALGIFSVLTGVVLFDYGKFQSRVDIKVLANDLALKIVEAQKSAVGGKLPPRSYPAGWKPSYGIYLDTTTPEAKKNIIYFTDLGATPSQDYNASACPGSPGSTDECLDKITITKGNVVSRVETYLGSTPTLISNPVSITFRRPDSSAVFKTGVTVLSGFDYAKITVASPSGVESSVRVYPSGRIEIN